MTSPKLGGSNIEEKRRPKIKKIITIFILFICIPAIIVAGAILFEYKSYAFITIALTILSLIPFFVSFERQQHGTVKLVLIAVMTALSILSRLLFAMLPGFKPVTAMVVITAIYFGREAGFLTGALTAVMSNFYFGQGPWTPFQMFTWGLIGYIAGVLANRLKGNKILLSIYGVFAGIFYSVLMDAWTVVWWEQGFNTTRFAALLVSALPFTIIYAVSNVIFLLILSKPIGEKIQRVKTKYGIE